MLHQLQTINSRWAAFVGFIMALPFVTLNAVVARKIEPYFSLIRPGMHSSAFEYSLLFICIFLIPLGALITILPMLQKDDEGERTFYLINIVIAAVLVAAFVLLIYFWGWEIYRCNILQIPNCA